MIHHNRRGTHDDVLHDMNSISRRYHTTPLHTDAILENKDRRIRAGMRAGIDPNAAREHNVVADLDMARAVPGQFALEMHTNALAKRSKGICPSHPNGVQF